MGMAIAIGALLLITEIPPLGRITMAVIVLLRFITKRLKLWVAMEATFSRPGTRTGSRESSSSSLCPSVPAELSPQHQTL